jgi:hypothetical protein
MKPPQVNRSGPDQCALGDKRFPIRFDFPLPAAAAPARIIGSVEALAFVQCMGDYFAAFRSDLCEQTAMASHRLGDVGPRRFTGSAAALARAAQAPHNQTGAFQTRSVPPRWRRPWDGTSAGWWWWWPRDGTSARRRPISQSPAEAQAAFRRRWRSTANQQSTAAGTASSRGRAAAKLQAHSRPSVALSVRLSLSPLGRRQHPARAFPHQALCLRRL